MWVAFCMVAVTAACQPQTATPPVGMTPRAGPTPVVTYYEPTAAPTATSMPAWQTLQTGVEYVRRLEHTAETDDWVTVVRLDLNKLNLKVHYAPASPQTVRTWYSNLNPLVVINAGFFTKENKATGLVIADGRRAGQTYKGFGGMFSVRDGKPSLQWLARTPYAADSRVTQAVQSFPMLLLNGKAVDGIPDDGSRNRRSFIGIDHSGKVLLGICHSPVWTMGDLVHYLQSSALLNLDAALNLDGGASSGLWVTGVPDAIQMDSLVQVPTVIAAYAR